MKQTIFNTVIIAALGVVIWLLLTNHQAPVSTTTTTVIDSTTYNHTTTNPTVYIKETNVLPVPANVDTAAILRAYFTSHYYEQTLIDTSAEIEAIVSDSVAYNRLVWRNIALKNLRATTITKAVFDTCPPPKKPRRFNLYAGGRFGIAQNQVSQITPVIGVRAGKVQVDYGYNLSGREHQIGTTLIIGNNRR